MRAGCIATAVVCGILGANPVGSFGRLCGGGALLAPQQTEILPSQVYAPDNRRFAEAALYNDTWRNVYATGSSFLQGRTVEILLDSIAPFCDHREPHTRWLECERAKDGTLVTKHGSYGLVAFGLIHNDGRDSVRVYKNAPLRIDERTKRGHVRLLKQNLLPRSSGALPVVLKINLLTTKYVEASQFPRGLTQESLHSRRATEYCNEKGQSVVPAIYDVVLRNTKLHPIHERMFIQERFDGCDADKLTDLIMEEVALTLKTQTRDLVRALASEKGATSPALKRRLMGMAERARREFLVRVRSVFTLFSALFKASETRMGRGFIHCDNHMGNCFVLRRKINSVKAYLALRDKGDYFIPGTASLARLNVGFTKAEREAVRNGLFVYELSPNNVRWIDSGFSITSRSMQEQLRPEARKRWARESLSRAISKQSGRTKAAEDRWAYPDKMASEIKCPCRMLRSRYPDLYDMLRVVSVVLDESVDFLATFSGSIKWVIANSKEACAGSPLLEAFLSQMIAAASTSPPTLPGQRGSSIFWQVFEPLYTAVQDVQKIKQQLSSLISNFEPLKACVSCDELESVAKEVIGKPFPLSEAIEATSRFSGCSIADQIGAFRALNRSLKSLLEPLSGSISVTLY